jgi:hypothetical protein
MLKRYLKYYTRKGTFRLIAAAVLLASSIVGNTQCIYDLDNNGYINSGDDLFMQLMVFGTEDAETDYNGNGVSDMRDMVEMMGYVNSFDCEEALDASDDIGELVLQEFYVHETPTVSLIDTIPAESITYRLFLEVEHPEDVVVSMYGDSLDPMWISTQGQFYHTPLGDGFVGITATQINPFLFDLISTMAYDTWLSMNDIPEMPNGNGISSTALDSGAGWSDTFQLGNDLLIDDPIGGGVINFWTDIGDTIDENLRLLGQFTVLGSEGISGQVNVEVRHFWGNPNSYGLATRTFDLANLAVFGCMNPEAENYDPLAEYDDGSCFVFGDLDGDGEVGIGDILEFLSDFPCLEDCGASDLNGDGVVNIFDLLILLGLL